MGEKKRVIGICASCIFDQIPLEFSNLLQKKAEEKGYSIAVFSAYRPQKDGEQEAAYEGELYELARHMDLVGLVLLTETIRDKDMAKRVAQIGHEKNIPVFSVDGRMDGCYNMPMDDLGGFEQLMNHIVKEHGCRRVNMLAGFEGNECSDRRVAIYRRTLEEAGIPVEEERIAYGDFWDRPARAAVNRFLDSGMELPEAIVCANDAMAVTTCSVLSERGLRVPHDIIVTGFDGIQCGKINFPAITTCEPDYASGAHFILEEVHRFMESGKVKPRDFTIHFALSKNQSCGCRSKSWKDINRTVSKMAEAVSDCKWHNIAMNNMVAQVLDKQNIMDIAKVLPANMDLWTKGFRFACVKTELLSSYTVPENYDNMTTILRECDGNFDEPGETFFIEKTFIPGLEQVMSNESTDILVVRLLGSGSKVYGYIAEAMDQLEERSLQRNNEFSMFLSHSISTVLHNKELSELNQSLGQAYQKIAALYIQDPMTGVLNRRGFYQALEEQTENRRNEGKYLYVYSIDMDGLKRVNDTYGHGEGDFAITTIAQAIVAVGGKQALCARFGGDEFVCALIFDGETGESAEQFWGRLKEYISSVPGIAKKPYEISASVGVCCGRISAELDTELLLSDADKRMYQNKVERKKQRV
ncbi:MAG: GGDEF domain-containing protein [Roseburia sp.]